MADLIKTVTDKKQFEFLLSNFFNGNSVFIKTSSGNINLQFLGYSEGNAAFRIPHVKSIPDNVVVYVRHGHNNIYLSMKFIERSEDTFLFIPIKFQIISESRKEDRKLVQVEGGGKSIIYVNNLVTEYMLHRELSTAEKKIDKVKEVAEFELKKKFEYVKILFSYEAKTDSRFKFILANSRALYVPNLNEDPLPELEDDFNHYINNIYRTDLNVSSRNQFISEITAPVMYNEVIPYGYVQVNGSQPFTEGILEVCKRMTIVVDQLLKKNHLLTPLADKFLISDLSAGGVGFVFKEKRLIRYFQEGSKVSFEIMLPTRKKAVMGAIVRNITFMENNIIKIGVEIDKMSDTCRENYMEYVEGK